MKVTSYSKEVTMIAPRGRLKISVRFFVICVPTHNSVIRGSLCHLPCCRKVKPISLACVLISITCLLLPLPSLPLRLLSSLTYFIHHGLDSHAIHGHCLRLLRRFDYIADCGHCHTPLARSQNKVCTYHALRLFAIIDAWVPRDGDMY